MGVRSRCCAKIPRGRHVLLLGRSDTRAEELAKEETQHGSMSIHTLEKWNPKMKTGHKLVWVLCWGIPLVAWDMAQIRKIVVAIGDIVEVDDDVEELRRLDRARVLIRTPWRPTLQHTVNLHIIGELYKVHIMEETGLDNGKCSYQARSNLRLSDEIDSDVSDTESPLSKAIGALDSDYAPRRNDGNSTDGVTTKGNKGNLLLPNGTTIDDEPGDNNPGGWAFRIDNNACVSALEAVNGMAAVAQPTLGLRHVAQIRKY